MKTLLIRLSDDLHKEFKVKCAQEETTMNTIVDRLIADYVRGKEGKQRSKPR